MKNVFDRWTKKRHHLVLEAENVLETLEVINSHYVWYVNHDLVVGNCKWAREKTKWFIHFTASNKQWASIVSDLNSKKYTLIIKNDPKDVYLIKGEES